MTGRKVSPMSKKGAFGKERASETVDKKARKSKLAAFQASLLVRACMIYLSLWLSKQQGGSEWFFGNLHAPPDASIQLTGKDVG